MARKAGLYNCRGDLDGQLHALANRKRRDILRWLSRRKSSNLKKLAAHFNISIVTAGKHTDVLFRGGLVSKNKVLKSVIVEALPGRLLVLKKYAENYKEFWIEVEPHVHNVKITDESNDIWRQCKRFEWRKRKRKGSHSDLVRF